MNKFRSIFVYILIVHLILYKVQQTEAFRFNFKKIVCNSTDPTFVIFEKCILKAVSRNNQYISLYAKLTHIPITDIKIRFQFMKRANGWKPFMYDITVRCDFLKKMNPLTKLIWSWAKDITNLNHSCPFDCEPNACILLIDIEEVSRTLFLKQENYYIPLGRFLLT